MPNPGLLLKLAVPAGQGLVSGARLGAAGPATTLRPLFSLPAPAAPAAAGLAAPPPQTWYRAEGDGLGAGASPWDLAHAALHDGLGVAGANVLAAEPDLEQPWPPAPAAAPALAAAAAPDPNQPQGQLGAPFDLGDGFAWHVDDRHSQLRAAREMVGEAGRAITIVHLDTGYDPQHKALPINLAGPNEQRNFVESGTDSAIDQTPTSGFMLNRGHGTGTIGILAGGPTAGLRSDPAIPANFGPLGGAPFAKVIPVRIANSVVHFWTSTVALGIDYARQIGADVVSMSMGGLPASSWADAVNLAYDAGVVLVTAAGNSENGLPTSLIVYPARFNRVIAACGVMAQGHPYYGLGNVMEGCAGPMSKMATAMAAYTPNTPWLKLGHPDIVDMSGTGTSSATPQVAAAAALWLAAHGDKFPRSWQRVEAVRAALFGAANRGANASSDPDFYFGRGTLRARAALDVVPDRTSLRQTDPDSGSFAFLHLLSSGFGATAPDPRRLAMYRLELTQLALHSKAAQKAVPDPGAPAEQISPQAQRQMLEAILDEAAPSQALRSFLEGALGRTATVAVPAPPASVPPTPTPKPHRRPASGETPRNGASVPRKVTIPRATRRRLRVFATDPADSSSLRRSFVNVATIEIPWEERLKPGPIGEYLEVVDIDPASNAAYPPIDLNDDRLLAQDGYAPSEGNPQFHQQMAYAVAMRTIRNFEIALGRRALWAERIVQGATAHDGRFEYVQRLRLYPHALREQNAYYSPEKKALLFGYFDDDSGPSRGNRTIFTCLSHDIVAHETTHALLDGLHRRFQEPTNPDVLAFHEAFADVVAIFQHFTFPELLRYEMKRLRGNLGQESMLSDLARQFGQSLHNQRALRQAIQPGSQLDDDAETAPAPLQNYMDTAEPHERGAILVAAVFEAFTSIYTRRTEDLIRIATGGTGLLSAGAIPPDLVERLVAEAVDTAQRVLTAAIRALDYMPPVDPTFGDYLRAIVTADADLAPDRGMGYRVAFAEAFARRGIYPPDITSVSPDGLLWQSPADPEKWQGLGKFLRTLDLSAYSQTDRRRAYESARDCAKALHEWLIGRLAHDRNLAITLGLDPDLKRDDGNPLFEVHSVRPALRTTADGEPRTDIVALITQRKKVPVDPASPDGASFEFRGGCTLLLDREYNVQCPIRFAISRPIWNRDREARVREYLGGAGPALSGLTYGGDAPEPALREPFAILHETLPRDPAPSSSGPILRITR